MTASAVLDADIRPAKHLPRAIHRRLLSLDSLADLQLPFTPAAAARQAWLLVKLAFTLLGYLGVGWRWTMAFMRLCIYAVLLLPGFLQVIGFYVFSPRVLKSIPYGHQPRQRLDLYVPPIPARAKGVKYPVVVFITGGAWTIGYKAWGALLAKRLSKHGVVVACLDYRNFPQGSAVQMLEDINTGISWVFRKIHHHCGDPDNIVLVGQSAGGQLGALALFRQAEQAATGRPVLGASPVWSPSDVRAFVGVSGAYDLEGLAEHLHRRGLYKNLFEQIMSINGLPALHQLSPLAAARSWAPGTGRFLPSVVLVHGTNDKSVPHSGTLQLHEALQAAQVSSTCVMIEGKGHTAFLLEDPMRGGRDLLMDLILSVVTGREESHLYSWLCPSVLCSAAGWVCPF